MTDNQVWDHALKHNLVILTKDTDFFYKNILSKQKVKVVHLEIGNCTLNELHLYFKKNWSNILTLLEKSDLIIAGRERLTIF